jgi:hypothetical protein
MNNKVIVLNTDARVQNRMVKQQEEQLAKKDEKIAVLQAMLLKKDGKRLELESSVPHSSGGTNAEKSHLC